MRSVPSFLLKATSSSRLSPSSFTIWLNESRSPGCSSPRCAASSAAAVMFHFSLINSAARVAAGWYVIRECTKGQVHRRVYTWIRARTNDGSHRHLSDHNQAGTLVCSLREPTQRGAGSSAIMVGPVPSRSTRW